VAGPEPSGASGDARVGWEALQAGTVFGDAGPRRAGFLHLHF